MKHLMLITLLVFSMNIVGTSQVKQKFRDKDNTSTIVVIKDDKAIDTDLLDSHFDLAQMNMSDQIMITTKPEETLKPENRTLPEATPIIEAPEFEEATANTNNDIDLFFEQEEKEELLKSEKHESDHATMSSITVTNKVEIAPKRARGNYPTKTGYEVKKAAQKKYYAKSKVKKRKKKNRKFFGKKKSDTCYNF